MAAGSTLSTHVKPLTGEGRLIGTLQYMAPEQLEGKEVDERTDIWALGLVLYEMMAGQRTFSGKSQASLIGAILKEEPPPLTKLQPMTPPALDRLVRKCLDKDPETRWQSAHDLADELKWVAGAGTLSDGAKPLPRRREWAAWVVAFGLGLALLGMAAALVRRPQQEERVVRFELPAPEGTELQDYLALSPDGSRLAFTVKDEDGLDRLFVRALDSAKSEAIVGTDGAAQPFWSPDGGSLGFFAEGKLKRVEIGGGAPQTIGSVPELRGATWGRDGDILFGISGAYGLWRVAATGGVPEPVSSPDFAQGETSHRWPYFLPDGRHFLYLAIGGPNASISVGSLDGPESERLVGAFSAPTYAASGHLLFVRDGALRAQAFDTAALRLEGEPLTLAEPVEADPNTWGGTPVSVGGDALALRSGRIGTVQLTWLDRRGVELGTLGPPGNYKNQALSPDGGRIVISEDVETHLSVVDLATGAFRRFTFKPERVVGPSWSPDGRTIAYSSTREGPFRIFLAPTTGAGTEETLPDTGQRNPVFSPDGQFLLYERVDPEDTQYDLWFVPLSGDRKGQPFLRTGASETQASFSPNGRFVAYASDESGRAEVYVRAFPGGEGAVANLDRGGRRAAMAPRWEGALLPLPRSKDDGGERRHQWSRFPGVAAHRSLPGAHAGSWHRGRPQRLHRQSRRAALPHQQARRGPRQRRHHRHRQLDGPPPAVRLSSGAHSIGTCTLSSTRDCQSESCSVRIRCSGLKVLASQSKGSSPQSF